MTEINAVAITIAPVAVEDENFILIGFNNPLYSQSTHLPYKGVEAATEFANQVREAIIRSAEEIRSKLLAVE